MLVDQVKGIGRRGRLVRVGLTVDLLDVNFVLRLLNGLRVSGGGEGPTDKTGQSNRRGPPPRASFFSLHSPFGELGSHPHSSE